MRGCDIEHCSVCKAQRLMCMGLGRKCEDHDPQQVAWEGEWPGKAECRERGWYSIMDATGKISTPSMGNWWPCTKDYPGATEDLNRWTYFVQTGNDPHENTAVLGRLVS